MANDFSKDSRIVEVWRFENNLNAEKNGNHLTASAGGVGYTSTNPLEGSYSLDLEADNDQWAYRNDADLSSGFPLKYGDTNKKCTIFLRAKPESIISGGQLVIGKAASDKYSWSLGFASSGMYFCWGYNNGASVELWTGIRSLSAGKVYHIAIIINGNEKKLKLRVYVDGVAYNYTKTFSDVLSVTDAPFVVGNNGYYSITHDFDGIIDEVVVANDIFSDEEIDLIYEGNYSARLIAGQVLGQVSYQPVASFEVSQVLAQVAYQPISSLPETQAIDITGKIKVSGVVEATTTEPVTISIEAVIQVSVLEFYIVTEPTTEVVNEATASLICEFNEPLVTEEEYEAESIKITAFIKYLGFVELVEPKVVREVVYNVIANVRCVCNVTLVREFTEIDYKGVQIIAGQISLVPVVELVPVRLVIREEFYEVVGNLQVKCDEVQIYEIKDDITFVVDIAGKLKLVNASRLEAADEYEPIDQIARIRLSILPPIDEDAESETWVLTGNGWQVSCYSNYGFNSYVNINGVCYGAKSDGIYLLEGDDDDGVAIRSGMRLISDFMTSNLKRIRHVQFGRCGKQASLQVQGRRSGQKTVIPCEQQRFVVPRQLVDQEFVFDLIDFEEVSQAEFVVLPWVKR